MTSKEIIAGLEDVLSKAMIESDVEKIEKLLHDDLKFVTPNGQLITKEMDLENWRSGTIKLDEIIKSQQNITEVGDAIIVTVIKDLNGTFCNNSFRGKFQYIRVWKLIENTWQIIAGSGTPLDQIQQ